MGAVSSEQLSVGFSRLRELGEETPRHGPILFPSGSACLLSGCLPARPPLRRGRRVHPCLLRVLRQPHLQTLWVWSVGGGIFRVWVQHNGLQSQLSLRGIPLCRLKPQNFKFVLL